MLTTYVVVASTVCYTEKLKLLFSLDTALHMNMPY